ncbi:MAG: hypothetical protein QW548_00870 [Candidatus Aenigmatarchaeota archaeon]
MAESSSGFESACRAFDYVMANAPHVAATLGYLATGIVALPFCVLMRAPDKFPDIESAVMRSILREERAYAKNVPAGCAGYPHMN